MKNNKFVVLGAALLLASCSLGANTISKDEFKRILEEEVKPTLVESTKTKTGTYGLVKGVRDINAKTLAGEEYTADSGALADFQNAAKIVDADCELSYVHSTISYSTKEIITSAGVKAFSDVEKVVDTTKVKLINNKTNQEIKTVKEVFHTTINTDYLSIELDPLTGRVATAEIAIDNDIYNFNVQKVVYDKFTEKNDSATSEDDPEIENPVISLAGTEWTLEDTTGTYKKVVATFNEDIDKIASKNATVGKITCENVEHNLYIFEREEGSYNFEIRETIEHEDETVLNTVQYDPSQANFIQTVVVPEINNFYANADVLAIEHEILSTYQGAYDYMKNNVDSNKKVEILGRVAGMVFRVNDGGILHETLLGKLNEEKNTRKITEVTERDGFDGNNITTYEFEGF